MYCASHRIGLFTLVALALSTLGSTARADDDVSILSPDGNNQNLIATMNRISVKFKYANGYNPGSVTVKSADGSTTYGTASGTQIVQSVSQNGQTIPGQFRMHGRYRYG